jgi:hypothetical protein
VLISPGLQLQAQLQAYACCNLEHAADFTSVELAAGKNTGMAVVAVMLAAWTLLPLAGAGIGTAFDLDSLWPGRDNPTSWLLIAWAALGPGALASVLQTFGQAHVPASRAQVCNTSSCNTSSCRCVCDQPCVASFQAGHVCVNCRGQRTASTATRKGTMSAIVKVRLRCNHLRCNGPALQLCLLWQLHCLHGDNSQSHPGSRRMTCCALHCHRVETLQ